jgi:hypothetical protein
MLPIAMSLPGYVRALLLPRHHPAVEIAVLRQQLAVFERKQPRHQMRKPDRLFWIVLRRCWPSWSDALVLVKPETGVSGHRTGSQWFWRWRSHPRQVGRPPINHEIRQLIRRMKTENPIWGVPRIHGELMLQADRFRLFATVETPLSSRESKALAHLLEQPSGSHRSIRLLYRANTNVPNSLLFLRNRARLSQDPAFSRHPAPDQ